MIAFRIADIGPTQFFFVGSRTDSLRMRLCHIFAKTPRRLDSFGLRRKEKNDGTQIWHEHARNGSIYFDTFDLKGQLYCDVLRYPCFVWTSPDSLRHILYCLHFLQKIHAVLQPFLPSDVRNACSSHMFTQPTAQLGPGNHALGLATPLNEGVAWYPEGKP